MAFQEILDQVGSLGRFQILQMTFLLICNAIISLHLLLENFTAAIPGHRCWVPLLDGGIVYHNGSGILSQEALLRISIPVDSNLRPEKCRRFVQPQWHLLHLNGTFSNVTEPDTELCVDGWVYDQSSFLSTTVTQWDLVCDSQSLTSIAKFVFLSGMFIGNILGGYLTDRFGRKLIFICFLLQMAITETCAALVPNFSTYCLLRFLAGVSTSCTATNIMLLMVEWTKPKFQALVMAMAFSAASLGQILLGGVAFAVRNWHHLQLATSIPIFFLLIPTRWLSESARWLIMTNQPQKCLKELRKAAKVNGVRSSGDMLTMEVVRTTMKEDLEAAQKKTVSCDLFCTPILRKRICLLSLVRFATWISIYGLIIHLQYLRSDVFLLQCLFGAVAIPANFLGIFSLNHVGRRVSQLLFMSLLGIFILALIFVPEEMQTLRLVLATLGGGISFTSVTGTLVHGNELLPTIIRARALGIIGVAGSIGSSLAPLIMILTTYSASLPWIIYGVFPILGGLLVFLLPETKNQPLPDSIQDVENEGKSSREAKPAGAFIKVTRF